MSKFVKLANNIFLFLELPINIDAVLLELKKVDWTFWGRNNNDPNQKIGEIASIKNNTFLLKEIGSIAGTCFEEYFKYKNIENNLYYFFVESIYFRKWHFPMQGMSAHTDYTFDQSGNRKKVDFTMLGYLNDDYRGGLLEFPEYGISIKPPAGSVIIFSADELHAVTDLIEGHRIMWSTFIYRKNPS